MNSTGGIKKLLQGAKIYRRGNHIGRDELPLVRTFATDSPIFQPWLDRPDEQELVPTESSTYGSKVTFTDVSPEMTMSIPFW
jgi:hypothetical protein